ncbi:MAG: class I SAM-dependent methyltransferase [Bacteroidia bacterium]
MNTLNRFSDRVENYIKFRPDYPIEIIGYLKQLNILTQQSVAADIGSGTGISAQPLLNNGNTVYGIEPNQEMRLAAEKLLKGFKNFISINATAEDTKLNNNSIDLIVVGQAFHWFDKEKCKAEFKRILKAGGAVILMWNDRRTDSTPFLREYEDFLLRFATDYSQVNHKNIDEKVFNNFFGENNYSLKSFNNYQHLDFEGLKGRVLSSSYMPNEGHPNYIPMIEALDELFSQFEKDNYVTLEYDTTVYYGKLN